MRSARIRLKSFVVFRVLPFLLACLMLTTSMPLAVFSVGEDEGNAFAGNSSNLVYDYDTLKITLDGDEIKELSIYPHEKIEVSGAGVPENAEYQWQIKHPERNNLWVDIYDATEDSIGVSAALISNMLAEDGTAALRLRAYTEDYAYLSRPVTVTLLDEEQPSPTLSVDTVTFPSALAGETSETPEFVTVTIEYEKYEYHYDSTLGDYKLDYMGPAFSSYIATLRYGSPMISDSAGITVPDIVGFSPVLVAADGITLTGNKAFLNLASVTENITFTIKYVPEKVDYEVRYRFQNVYDDSYVTDTSINDASLGITNGIYYGEGYTGLPPYYDVDGSGNLIQDTTKKGVYAEFDGFAALYYQPDTIAADGSTVFEVYYERTYYLMEFDCNGGYGAHTLYVRHGTYIYVPDPIKTGYVFVGWDGNGDGDTTDPDDQLPSTMPIGNTSYTAVWTEVETTYTVVYWIKNEDGTKTYIGSRPVIETSAEKVSGSDDLSADMDLCGFQEHTHTSCTLLCGEADHVHNKANGCYGNCTCSHDITCYTDATGIDEATDSHTGYQNNIRTIANPDEGVIYRYCSYYYGYTYYYNYIYIGGIWYYLGTGSGTSIKELSWSGTEPTYDNVSESSTSNSPTLCSHTHNASCLTCALHAHEDKCYSCGKVAHTHSDSCKNTDAPYMKFVEADQNVIVEGDGSTVVNVYYEYKTYTFKFYYAKEESGKYYIPGGSTWAFAGSTNNIETQLYDVRGIWGQVNAKPSLNTTAFSADTYDEYTINGTKGKYYYISLSAKYNEDISKKWPANPFNSVQTASTFSHGNYAYFSAWNVDANTWYDNAYENKTLKGNYQRLDYKLLIDEDTTTLNYLAFWENGIILSDNNKWNKPHKWIYKIYTQSKDTEYVHEYNGIQYDLYGTYTIYDDNTSTSDKPYCGQTPTALEGYELLTHNAYFVETYNSTYGLNTYEIDFYYEVNDGLKLSLYNYNNPMEDKGNSNAYFGMKLSQYEISATDMQNNYYPEGIEPGAYVFGGWYTTPKYLDGTEVDWDTLTMPDGNLTLYAKWTPVVRNITFYLLYTDIAEGKPWYPPGVTDAQKPGYYPIKVPHGDLLGTAYSHTPTRDGDYQFIGWFYFDENGKKKFAPDSMKVTRDLILFAEWHSSIVTTYEVEYQAYKYVDGGSGDELLNDKIASPLNDYSTAGKTVTFNAKGGKAMYDGYQSGWFPNSSSHSILMDADSSKNTHIFKYYKKDYINYKVMYINRITGDILGETGPIQTVNAVVTEKFKPFAGYIPEEYYIEKSIAYDPTDYTIPGNENHVSDENIIYFYYVPDTEHALHRFEHHIETLVEGDYTLYSADQGPHKIDEVKKATVENITGFELTKIEITTYTLVGGTWEDNTETIWINNQTDRDYYIANGIERAVTLGGLDIKFYYDRIEYDYTIQYVEDVNNANVLYTTTAKARYGTTVSHTAPASYLNERDTGDDGLLYIYRDGIDSTDEKRTAEKVITDDPSKNVLTFVYAKKRITVEYHIVCDVEALEAFNSISIANETVASATELMGCIASIGTGFIFKGWYYDEECTLAVPPAWVTVTGDDFKLLAQEIVEGADGKEHFYAKFEPISGNLTITKTVSNPDGETANSNFLFYIKGQNARNSFVDMVVSINGTRSVTIDKLPIGDYKVTELTDWSWEYSISESEKTKAITITQGATTTITFTNTDNNSNWLNGEAVNENQFN